MVRGELRGDCDPPPPIGDPIGDPPPPIGDPLFRI
jgi:hypothetical protein